MIPTTVPAIMSPLISLFSVSESILGRGLVVGDFVKVDVAVVVVVIVDKEEEEDILELVTTIRVDAVVVKAIVVVGMIIIVVDGSGMITRVVGSDFTDNVGAIITTIYE